MMAAAPAEVVQDRTSAPSGDDVQHTYHWCQVEQALKGNWCTALCGYSRPPRDPIMNSDMPTHERCIELESIQHKCRMCGGTVEADADIQEA